LEEHDRQSHLNASYAGLSLWIHGVFDSCRRRRRTAGNEDLLISGFRDVTRLDGQLRCALPKAPIPSSVISIVRSRHRKFPCPRRGSRQQALAAPVAAPTQH